LVQSSNSKTGQTMKFTEEKLEQAIITLLGAQGYPSLSK
jgi:hypothetical protein